MKYRLLVLDLDGTLLDGRGEIAPADRNAIIDVAKKGVRIALSTGRGLPACQSIIEQLNLDGYHISYDGALVSNPHTGEEVFAQPLVKEHIREAVEYAEQKDIPLELFSSTNYFVQKDTWSTRAHSEFFKVKAEITDFRQLWENERLIKGGLVAVNESDMEKVKEFEQKFHEVFSFSWAQTPAYPGVNFINMLDFGVNKGNALANLAEYLEISPSEIVAIGDGLNDLSLLSEAGLGVAMANAPREVKEMAGFVTTSVDDNGVANCIKWLW